jgi:hypothetical protein
MIWPWLQEDLRVRQVAASDVAGELARRMYQVPVVPERQHGFFLSSDFHFAKSHSPSKVLLVKQTQTSGVKVLLQDSVLLAEMHGVDLMTVHQVDQGQFGREALHTGRLSKDEVRRLGQQEVCFG